jgi:2-polyprenyl-3-methyl-5-hydroxy-6-metoxy-1,4-benzoquinol methylase
MSKYSEKMPPDLKTAIGWMYDYIQPGKTFLDFGCSTGYFGNLIKVGKQCKVYGVEISSDAKEARKVLDGVYSFDLDGEWPGEVFERKYDYLFFGDVLEHLKHPDQVLVKAKRLLKPKTGKVFVSTPNIAHMSIRLELLGGNFEYEPTGILDNTHLQYFTLDSFSRLASESGYAVEAVDYTLDDYPTKLITQMLKKYGLTPTADFWKEADTIEARSSQYKFILAPVQKVAQKSAPAKPIPPKPNIVRDHYVDDLRRQKEALHEHANKQAEIIEHYVNLSKLLEAENKHLKARLLSRISAMLKNRAARKKS